MNWTTEYPKKPGFYWIRNYRRFHMDAEPEFADPVIVEVDEVGDFYLAGVDNVQFKHHVIQAEWQGPIEPEKERRNRSEFIRATPRTACHDCNKSHDRFISWQIGTVNDAPLFGMICPDCWIKRLTPEQRKVYMV